MRKLKPRETSGIVYPSYFSDSPYNASKSSPMYGDFDFIEEARAANPIKTTQAEVKKEINGYSLSNPKAYEEYSEMCEAFGIDFEAQFFTPVNSIADYGVYGVRGVYWSDLTVGGSSSMLGRLVEANKFNKHMNFSATDSRVNRPDGGIVSSYAIYDLRDLFLIASGEKAVEVIQKRDEINAERLRKAEEKAREKALRLVAFRERSYAEFTEPLSEPLIDRNFIERGTQTEDLFMVHQEYFMQDCCALFKEGVETDDYIVYIPEDWANPLGYNEEFVVKYINLINSFGLGDMVYLGKGARKGHSSLIREEYGSKFSLLNDSYYRILIPNNDSPMISYVRFVMLRFLYHREFNHVPGLFFALREELKELSDWQLMLVACATTINSGFYGLISTTGVDYCYPLIFNKGAELSEVMKKIVKSGNVNLSIPYSCMSKREFLELQSLVRDRNFSKLIERIKLLK